MHYTIPNRRDYTPRYYYKQTLNPHVWFIIDTTPAPSLDTTLTKEVVARTLSEANAQLVTRALNAQHTLLVALDVKH